MASRKRGQCSLRPIIRLALALSALLLADRAPAQPGAVSARAPAGIPQPGHYAALLEKARSGQLRELHAEPPVATLSRGPVTGVAAETFRGSYRASAKTSFASGTARTYRNLPTLFASLPDDRQMAQQFPALIKKANNTAPRVPLENRNLKVPAWIYWVAPESDRDFHVILGSTAQLTTATVFLNAEISGLPPANPAQPPFAQRRADIRAILAAHQNVNGLFVRPVPVTVTGSLLWDGEHRAPNNVGPEGLQPSKAWEIHPLKQLTIR